eukprot:3837199-Rhodomonas_salina.1
MAGNARLMTARAFVDAKKTLREGKSMTEVTKQLRAMRASERWNPPPPEICVSRFFARYSSPDQNPLKRVLTPEK